MKLETGDGDVPKPGDGEGPDSPQDEPRGPREAKEENDRGGSQDGGTDRNLDRNGHWERANGDKPSPGDIDATDRRAHILYGEGDGKGGGHKHDSGVPGKSTFPASWGDDKIIGAIEEVARNPDSPPVYDEDDDNWTVRGTKDRVDIEVIVEPDGYVRTGYPTGGEGIHRNDENGDPQPFRQTGDR